MWREKIPGIANTILKKMNKVKGLITPEFRTTFLQSYSNQDRVALVKQQTNRLLEQNRKPRNRLISVQSTDRNKETKTIQWAKIVFLIHGAGTTEYSKTEKEPMTHILCLLYKLTQKGAQDKM